MTQRTLLKDSKMQDKLAIPRGQDGSTLTLCVGNHSRRVDWLHWLQLHVPKIYWYNQFWHNSLKREMEFLELFPCKHLLSQ